MIHRAETHVQHYGVRERESFSGALAGARVTYQMCFGEVKHTWNQPYPTTLKNGRRLNIPRELIEQRAPHLMGRTFTLRLIEKNCEIKYLIIYDFFLLFGVDGHIQCTFCE